MYIYHLPDLNIHYMVIFILCEHHIIGSDSYKSKPLVSLPVNLVAAVRPLGLNICYVRAVNISVVQEHKQSGRWSGNSHLLGFMTKGKHSRRAADLSFYQSTKRNMQEPGVE